MPSRSAGERYCQDCGAAVAPDANFCPDCGTSLSTPERTCAECGGSVDPDDAYCASCGAPRRSDRSRRSDSATEDELAMRAFRQRVQDHLAAGWDLEHDHGDRVVLVDRDIGSIGIHILLLLFTGGLGNLLYGWYHYSKLATRRQLSVDDSAEGSLEAGRSGATSNGSASGDAIATLFGVVVVLVSAYLVAVGVLVSSLGLSIIGLICALFGLWLTPPVKRRLRRRHSVTTFGRVKRVDNRIIRASEHCEQPCVVCQAPIDRGLVRRRRDETVVAGVPIRAHTLSSNHYCEACARDEFAQAESANDDVRTVSREPATE